MTGPTKKKLCWNCEGSVSLHEENCPYCGVYLSPSDGEIEEDEGNDLFSPPYRPDMQQRVDEIPPSPFSSQGGFTEVAAQSAEKSIDIAQGIKTSSDELKRVVIPLSMLLSGTVFFLFGLALFLFSKKGVFILQWNGAYWYYYLAFGLIALMFGWRCLSRVEDSD